MFTGSLFHSKLKWIGGTWSYWYCFSLPIMDAPCKNSWFLVRMFFPQKRFHSHVFGNCYCRTPIVRDDPKLPSISPGGASTSQLVNQSCFRKQAHDFERVYSIHGPSTSVVWKQIWEGHLRPLWEFQSEKVLILSSEEDWDFFGSH